VAPETVITYTINEAGAQGPRALRFHAQVDGEVVAANVAVSASATRELLDLSGTFNGFFEHSRGRGITVQALEAFGSEFGRLGDGWAWNAIDPLLRPGPRRLVVVASELSEVLNLPWELLRLPGGEFIGQDARYGVRRVPWIKPLPAFQGELPPRPLRVLFMACAPQDQLSLDHEREEEALLKALGASHNVAFDSGDLGTFEELRQRIVDFKPHVVHLTGHGQVKDGLGWFAFEDERGGTDLRSSREMRQRLFAASSVECAFISGCQTGKAPPIGAVGGICQGLVSEDVPMAIGWAASIADDLATRLATTFYDTLGRGETVDYALVAARQAIRPLCEERLYPAWALPVVYSATTQGLVVDPDPGRPSVPPLRPSVVQQPLPGMIEGYAEHFVGRRRELQRLLPSLREGKIQTVVITGMGGTGKSTLATRLARKLEAEHFTPVAVPSAEGTPLRASNLLQALGDAFVGAEDRDARDVLADPSLEVAERLRYAVMALNRGRFVLVLDNFEVNLDEASKLILDAEVARFYTYLLEHLAGRSRCIITSRFLPANVLPLPRTVQEESLADFPETSFIKFLLADPQLEQRYARGELPHELLGEMHRLLGGTPRFLDQVRTLLHTVSKERLAAELRDLDLGGTLDAGELQALRERYLERIVTARLFGYLPPESQAALCRAAVYGVAVSAEALGAVTGASGPQSRAFARQWHEEALAYPDRDQSTGERWAIHGLLRGWLLAPERLGTEERRAAHRAAGTYLRALVEKDREGEIGLSWIDCFREARRQFLAAGEWEPAREVTVRISGFLSLRGLHDDLVSLNEELLGYEEHPRPMSWIARSWTDRSSYEQARHWYQRALEQAGDAIPTESAVAWHGLASIDLREGSYPAAREKFQRSLEILQAAGDRAGQVAAFYGLASIDLREGSYPAAREKCQRSLEILQAVGNRAGEAATWHQLATIDVYEGSYPAAREKFQRSLEILQAIGNRAGEAATWHQLATIDVYEGSYPAARGKLQRSLDIRQAVGDRAGEAAAFFMLGRLAGTMGRADAEVRLLGVCFLIDQAIGHGDTPSDWQAVVAAASQLGYSEDRLKEVLQEVAYSYGQDQGRSLVLEAVGDIEP
jgi:tetratricopeptide (TPR) repeat protein